jgi:ABC-type maltose transport system permease subunit
MAQAFMRDDELCRKYAKFAADLDRWHFKIIYWFMFVLNLVILFIASWAYTRYAAYLTRIPNAHSHEYMYRSQVTNEQFSHEPRRRARMLVRYMLMCLACVLVSAAVVVMEAFSLLALQFCDGENLISLYWSTWTMIQVGSLIAMMGIILAMAHSLRNRRHP